MEAAEIVSVPARILEIGCGTGLLTGKLADAYPAASIEAVDIAPGMIEHARKSLQDKQNLSWTIGDICKVILPGPFELAISSSSFQWVSPLGKAFTRIRESLASGGYLVFSMMLKETLHELQESRMRTAPQKPVLHKLPTRGDVLGWLDCAGYELVTHDVVDFRVEYDSAWGFLKSINKQGVTAGSVSFSQSLLNRVQLKRLAIDYDDYYSAGGGKVYATYEVLTAVAEKRH